MNRKTVLIILILIATTIPLSYGTETTIPLSDNYDDVWMTESGNIFYHTSSVLILDNEIGLRSFLRFQNVPLSKSDRINLAQLRVYVDNVQVTPDPGSSVTVYGIDEPDCGPFTSDGSLWSLERAYTSALVNWNLTTWTSGWTTLNVTDIVKEIINQYAWAQNNSLGFQILGASDSGQESRWFEDYYHPYHEAQAQLFIQYNVAPGTPPGLPDTSEWVETYQDWDIWESIFYVDSNMSVFWEDGGATATYYHTTYARGVADGADWDNITMTGNYRIQSQSEDPICQVGDTVIILQDWGRVQLWYSHDYGATWAGFILNDQFTNLTGHTTDSRGALAVDVNGTVHVTWGTFTDASPAVQRQVYSNFTVMTNGTFNFYPGFTEFGPTYGDENMEADQYGRVAIVGLQTTDIKMWFRFMNGTWAGQETIEDTDNLDEPNVDMADQSWGDYPLMRFVYYRAWVGIDDIYQTIRLPNGTRIDSMLDSINCFDPTTAVEYSNNVSWATWTDIPGGVTPRIVLRGYDFTTQTLMDQEWVSPIDEQHRFSDIGIGGDGLGYIVWYSQWFNDMRGRRFYTNTSNPVTFVEAQHEEIVNLGAPNTMIGIVPWNLATYSETQYYLVDENGTVIDTWTLTPDGENFTDIEDLKDWTDDVVNPEGGDPLDPAPGSGWEETGPFTRFRMRLYFLVLGVACIFGPLWAISYRRPGPQGVAWCAMLILIGLGLLISIPNI